MSANVNKPTDVKVRDADIARKLQLYGIFTAFRAGKVPSNDQIDVALNSFLESKAMAAPSDNLSDEGKVLVTDAREVVKQAKYLLLSKNEGNLLQDFIWQTEHWDPKAVSTPDAPVDKHTAQQDGKDAIAGLRTLGTLLITNGQFRKLLKDASILFRDIAADAATNTAGLVRPSEEKLAQMDQAAEDNAWHDVPDFSQENVEKKMHDIYGGKPKDDLRDIARSSQTAAKDDPNSTPAGVSSEAGKAATTGAIKKTDGKVGEEDRERIKARNEEYRRKAKEYYNKKMPQDRKDQTIWRLKKMVLECQQHPDYSRAIQTLLDLAKQYGSHGRVFVQGGSDAAKDARGGLSQAEYDLKTIIERFANGTSTDPLWSAINRMYENAEHDEELKEWFKAIDRYIRRCLLEQGYVLDDESNREWDDLYEHGRYLLREKYRAHTDRIVDEIKFVAEQFDHDPQNKAFAQSLQTLLTDLGKDESGKVVFKPHLLRDIRDVILPAILENVAYIPVPRIEYQDPQVDCIIENLVLESDNFAPNVLELASEHYFRWGRKKMASNKSRQQVELKVAGVQMDLRDVSYYVKRKKGFPSITDTGVMDILLPGNGFSFKIMMSTPDSKDAQNFFKIDKVDVDFKTLKINVKESKYKLLFSLFKPIALRVLRTPIKKMVEKALKAQATQFDALLFQIKQDAEQAKAELRLDPAKAPSMYHRYYSAVHRRVLQGKEKAQAKVADKKVNMAMTKEDSIFPEIQLPGGTSSKATEYRELAKKGEKWESPVFSIGKAAKSTDIPPAPRVEKKMHASIGGAGLDGSRLNGRGYSNGHSYSNGNGRKQTQIMPGTMPGSDSTATPRANY